MINMNYIKAGNATFTFANPKNERYTYKVKYSKKINQHFVYLLTGANNETDYTYMGMFAFDRVQMTRKSKYKADSIPVKVFNYAMTVISGYNELLNGYFLEHDGHCGRCGRKLTTPESIKAGLGPVCIAK